MLPTKLTALLGKLDTDYAMLTGAVEDQADKTAAAERALLERELADQTVEGVAALVDADKQAVLEFVAHYPDGPDPVQPPEPTDPQPSEPVRPHDGVNITAGPKKLPFDGALLPIFQQLLQAGLALLLARLQQPKP